MAGKRTLVVVMLALAASVAWAGSVPEAVSPGKAGGVARVSGACPSFSWGAVEGSQAYELVVYSLGVSESGDGPILSVRIPGSALSWTPSLDECLAPGWRYVWFVRSTGKKEAGEWSEGRVFEIAAEPTIAEVEQALRVLERFVRGSEERTGLGDETSGDEILEPGLPETDLPSPTEEPQAVTTGVEIAETSITVGGADVVTTATDQDTLAGMSCADGQLAKWHAGSSSWVCGAYTAGNQLTLTASTFGVVEGSGSDLNADLLDDLDSTAFAASTHAHSGGEITGGTVSEVYIDPLIARDSEIVPTVIAGDGTGSGLDADLLDGQESSSFASSGHGHSTFVLRTGDTMSGALTLNNDLELVGKIRKGGVDFLSDDGSGGNVALGRGALAANAGTNNTSVGYGALQNTTTGSRNSVLGPSAMQDNVGGWMNTAIGESALKSNRHGHENTAVGAYALENSRGYYFEGPYPGEFYYLSENTALGARALQSNTEGYYNTALGASAMKMNTFGAHNTAVGRNALRNNVHGSENTGVGEDALRFNSGWNNTAVGNEALRDSSSAWSSTAVGWNALKVSTGSGNIGIGALAGDKLTTGSNNIMIGHRGVAGEANTIRIGNPATQVKTFVAGIHGTAVTGQPVAVDSGGQLGVGSFGSSSGLDADKLDGLHATSFLRSNTSDSYTAGKLTFNAGTTLEVDGSFVATDAVTVYLPTNNIFGAGSGSNLDADFLDGKHASAFMTAATDNWVNVTGDSMTGQLVVSASVVGDETLSVLKGSGTSPSGAALGVVNTTNYGEAAWLKLTDKANTLPVLKLVLEAGSGSDFLQCDLGGTKCRIDKNGIFVFTPTDSPSFCDSTLEGGLYYDDSLNEMCYCNGGTWRQVDGGGYC